MSNPKVAGPPALALLPPLPPPESASASPREPVSLCGTVKAPWLPLPLR